MERVLFRVRVPTDGETCQSEGTCLHEPGTGQHLALLELHSVLIPWKNHLKCGSGEPSETVRVSVLGSWKPRLKFRGPTGSTNGFSVEMLGENHLDFRSGTDQQHLRNTLFRSDFESAVTVGNYSKWMNEWMNDSTDERMWGRVDRRKDGTVNRWMGGWMVGWIYGWK